MTSVKKVATHTKVITPFSTLESEGSAPCSKNFALVSLLLSR